MSDACDICKKLIDDSDKGDPADPATKACEYRLVDARAPYWVHLACQEKESSADRDARFAAKVVKPAS